MKIAILTTDTLHHSFFAREISKYFSHIVAICETNQNVLMPYKTDHPFELERDRYEREKWFDGQHKKMDAFVPTIYVPALNDPAAIIIVEKEQADIFVVFGTSHLKPVFTNVFSKNIYNLHGGDPERYRGLDTHLWSIFHNDFTGLVTTLHQLEPGLDAGRIVVQGEVPLFQAMAMHALRAANTELCVSLVTTLIDMYKRFNNNLIGRQQLSVGRYYNAMPSDLKAVAIKRFNAHIKKIY